MTVLAGRRAKLDAKDNDGNTPMHVAARWGQRDAVELLQEKGADDTIRNKNGQLYSDLVSGNLITYIYGVGCWGERGNECVGRGVNRV